MMFIGISYHIDSAQFIDESRILVHLRYIFESLGADVECLEESREVRITMENKEVMMTIGELESVLSKLKKLW